MPYFTGLIVPFVPLKFNGFVNMERNRLYTTKPRFIENKWAQSYTDIIRKTTKDKTHPRALPDYWIDGRVF
jgi:hypothetical protein